jgi:hypothetical protein
LCFSICLKDWKWSSQAGYTTGHQSMPRKWKSLWSKDETGGKKKKFPEIFETQKLIFYSSFHRWHFKLEKIWTIVRWHICRKKLN